MYKCLTIIVYLLLEHLYVKKQKQTKHLNYYIIVSYNYLAILNYLAVFLITFSAQSTCLK